MTQPKRTKVHLLVEAEVDDAEGFTEDQLRKIAVGNLWKHMIRNADSLNKDMSVTFHLDEGDVDYGKPKLLANTLEIVDDGEGKVWVLG